MNLLRAKSISETYGSGEAAVHALESIGLSVPEGEFVAIVGESGSDRSILLNMIGALDTPTSGDVLIDGRDILSLDDSRLTIFQRRNIGFISQSLSLIPKLDARQNTLSPVLLDHQKPDKSYLEELLLVLDLTECRHHFPNQLSSGQQQRTAIRRVLITRPALILAGEPAGNLDIQGSREIIALLKGVVKKHEQTIIMIAHSRSITQPTDRVLQVSDGVLIDFGGYRG